MQLSLLTLPHESLRALEEELVNQFNDEKALLLLSNYRTLHYQYNSILVVDIGRKLIDGYSSSLGDQYWDVIEQVFLSALDCGFIDYAIELYKMISNSFKGSVRCERLKALQFEAIGKFELATEIYEVMREKNPTDSFPYKRLIAITKGNNIVKAIGLLNEYLDIFMADIEAWAELGELYLYLREYENASFCYEEIILAEPDNFHYHVKYAEIKFTMGGFDNLNLAKYHYSHSLELNNENNYRGLYGLCLTIHALSKTKGNKLSKDDISLFSYAENLLREKYQDNDKQAILDGTLNFLRPKELKNN